MWQNQFFIVKNASNGMMFSMPFKAILFDCDGTLIDSEEAHLAAWEKTLQNRGLALTSDNYSLYTGYCAPVIAATMAKELGCPEAAQEILLEKIAHYQSLHQKGLPAIEGTVNFAKMLAKEKEQLQLKLGVASAALKIEIESHLNHLKIKEIFDIVLSGQEDLNDYFDPEGVNKPKPYIYLHAAKLLNVKPSECIVIEDSFVGVQSGKSAGCFTIAIPNRYTENQDLSSADLKLKTLDGFNLDSLLRLIS